MQVPPSLYDEHKRPLNKGCVYICESSPEVVSQAYYQQFQEDFSLFLRSRSEELVVGGRMVLIFLGRRGPEHVDRGNSFFWEILSRSFAILVSQVHLLEDTPSPLSLLLLCYNWQVEIQHIYKDKIKLKICNFLLNYWNKTTVSIGEKWFRYYLCGSSVMFTLANFSSVFDNWHDLSIISWLLYFVINT